MTEINWIENWPEYISTITLAIGIVLALMSKSSGVSYIAITLSGLFFGRIWHKLKHEKRIPLAVTIVGFLSGFLIGSIALNIKAIIILFIIGMSASYTLHERKIITRDE